jgi:hypothetical protein
MGCACSDSTQEAMRNRRGENNQRTIVIREMRANHNLQEAQRQNMEEEKKSICIKLL